MPRPLYPRGKNLPVPNREQAGWTSEPVWTIWGNENSCLTGNRIPIPLSSSPQPIAVPTAILRLFRHCTESELSAHSSRCITAPTGQDGKETQTSIQLPGLFNTEALLIHFVRCTKRTLVSLHYMKEMQKAQFPD
jgi:hypothetical protein